MLEGRLVASALVLVLSRVRGVEKKVSSCSSLRVIASRLFSE